LLLIKAIFGRGFKESEVEFTLRSCEAYGRFALHKAAHKSDELGINRQAKTLLEWSTENVISALLGVQSGGESELRDLDLSRISNVSDSLIIPEPKSPTTSSPKHRANLRQTPERGRPSSLLHAEDETLHDPAVFLVSAAARSLLQSSCIIFAEFLAVGGSCGGEVANAAIAWCKIFDQDIEREDHCLQRMVLPCFIRLAIQLCKSSSNVSLLRELFVRCSEDALKEDCCLPMKKAVTSLLNVRSADGFKLTKAVVEAFLSAVDELQASTKEEESLSFEAVESVDGVWSHSKGCLATVLEAVVGNQGARHSLARKVVTNLRSSSGEMTAYSMFESRCLSLIATTDRSVAMAEIIGELEVEKFDEGEEMRCVVQKVLKSTT
jgi:hypothetical protein